MIDNTCGCCELPASTPLVAFNRPGLSAIAFRAGTYSSFRLSMLQRIAGMPALSALKTRSDDDYAITLLDMWATVADVLTFYQERIANEGFLRTARYRDSVLRMARLLDYQLRPGVAATALLAFTLDKDASLEIQIGLRVQSVPPEGEQPQVYETLESFVANASLNRVRILPAPEGFNPLAKGSTSAILAPGDESLAAAAVISLGDRFVLIEPSGQLEELTVRERRVEEDRMFLSWIGPIQGTNWTFDSLAYAVNRTFRVFGYNAPTQYLEAVETPAGSGVFVWTRRTYSSYEYIPSGNIIELDSKYEGINAGSRLLISQPGSNHLVTVNAVSQGQATFLASGAATSPVQDTVTRVALSAAPTITDRRNAVIYEVKSPRIRFWGYRYPAKVSGSAAYISADRIDAQTAEIGRVIESGKYSPGTKIALTAVDVGRQVIGLDANQHPAAATVASISMLGLDVTIATTANDFTTAIELHLEAESAHRVTGLRSTPLPSSFTLTSIQREMSVTIGSLPARTIVLTASPSNGSTARTQLEAALNASLPPAPEFSQARVLFADSTLIVLPGVHGSGVAFAPTSDDPTTCGELGLASPGAIRIDGLLSGDLSPFPVVTSPFREISVTFGLIGPRIVTFSSAPGSLSALRTQLEPLLIAADPAPAFKKALVLEVGSRLLILPGTGGSPIQDYLALTLEADSALDLDASSAVLLGNVAWSSHGEKVVDEVIGDGDASAGFQKFELQKKPLTYTPSAGPGGMESTLKVSVNNVLWIEVPTLFGKTPTEQVYTTRLADDGSVTVGFGDGRTGARLPSGRGNVVADYRQGSGLDGRVPVGALKTPLDLPVGMRSITNPAAATGGADPESLDQARENAPTTVRTFGRAVSLRDFEDLVRSSGEVAKALATWVWNGEARAVHLTIAAQEGQLFTPDDLERIHASLTSQRDPNHTLFLDNYTPVPVVIKGTVRVEANRVASQVGEAAQAALLDALSFDSLRFGEPLDLSEVYAVLQQVAGVNSVDIDMFQFKNQSLAFLAARGATTDPVQRSLRIFSARPSSVPSPPVLPAELAAVETPAEDIEIITSGGLPE